MIKTDKLADEQDYISTQTGSKARHETNKAIMSKAHEAGGDLMSSGRLASAFLTLGIDETSADEAGTEPLTYKTALQSPQAREWKEAMCQEWQHWSRTTRLTLCKERKVNPDGSTRYKARLVIKGYEQKESEGQQAGRTSYNYSSTSRPGQRRDASGRPT